MNFNFKRGLYMGYNTKQQECVLECLKKNNGKHMTADEIYIVLRQQGNPVGKTTVYRHLEKLTNEGVIRRFTIGDNTSACYQLTDSHCSEHYHLKCSGCGRLIHIECDYLDELAEHLLKEHSFVLDRCKTVLYGKCSECAKEK